MDSMADKEQPRSIRFPQSLWDAIDRDAIRCGRSAVKQMEVVLSAYYGLRDVELDHTRLGRMRGDSPQGVEVAAHSKKRIPLISPEKLEEKKSDGVKKKKRVS